VANAEVEQLNISYPANGSQKLVDVEDERKLRVFMDKRVRLPQSRTTMSSNLRRKEYIELTEALHN